MSYDRRTRDRFRLVVTGVTGGIGVAALTVTGLLMGLASRDFTDQQATDQQATDPAPARKDRPVRLKQRPHITRVTVRYVTEGSSNPVGAGGSVTASDPVPAPAPAPAPTPEPEPAPAPEPAPSSGS